MKKSYIFIVLIALLFQACSISNQDIKVQNKILLNDIWVLKKVKNNAIDIKKLKQIDLEFNMKTNKFYGTDGCNRIFGGFKEFTNDKLIFGPIASTRMACSNMKISYEYLNYLKKVKSFKIENLKLYLLDEDNKTLLEYLKVD
jgi:putative lipoprotein